jgi:hypothetical protein
MSEVMERFGYLQTDTIVNGSEFGGFEKRSRIARVWYSKNLPEFDISQLVGSTPNQRKVSDILEDVDDEASCWSRRKYLEAKQLQKNNNHKYCIVSEEDTLIPVLSANYFKFGGDTPLLPHPTKELHTRGFSVSEHCNLRSITGNYKDQIVAVAKGTHSSQRLDRTNVAAAHRMLGNSVEPLAWKAVGAYMGEWFSTIKTMSKKFTRSKVINFPPMKQDADLEQLQLLG